MISIPTPPLTHVYAPGLIDLFLGTIGRVQGIMRRSLPSPAVAPDPYRHAAGLMHSLLTMQMRSSDELIPTPSSPCARSDGLMSGHHRQGPGHREAQACTRGTGHD